MALHEQPLSANSATLDGCPRAWHLTLHLLQEPLPWFHSDQRLGPISEPRFPIGQPQMGGVGLRPSLPLFWVRVADVRVTIVTRATKATRGNAGLRPCVSAA